MATASDNYNRADSSTVTGHTEDSGDWAIVSNTLRQTSTGNVYRKIRYTDTAPATNDHESEIDGRSSSSGIGFHAIVRAANSAAVTDYRFGGYGGDAFYLEELAAGTPATLDTGSACTASTTYNARVRAVGSAITGYRNDVEDCAATDSTLSSGGWGIGSYSILSNTNDWADNWLGADVGGAADPEGALVGGKLVNGGLLMRGVLVGH